MNWRNLFWAECRKLRRSKMILIAVAAVFLTAGILFVGGLEVYHGLEVHYGLKVMRDGMRYLENAGWYMDEMQPWAFLFCDSGYDSSVWELFKCAGTRRGHDEILAPDTSAGN